MARTLLEANGAASTPGVIDFVAFARTQFPDRPLRTGAIAAVALKAVATGKAASGFAGGACCAVTAPA